MVELPGIGKSSLSQITKDYLCEAIEAIERVRCVLGFDTWNVLGYSTGSRIAEAYVQTYASHVTRAIFLCPLKVESFKLIIVRFCFWIDGFIPTFIPWILRGWRLKILIIIYGFSLHSDAHIEDWHAEISKAPVQVLTETANLIIPIGTKPFFVPVPFLLIWGSSDLVPNKPHKPGQLDHFVQASHAAPILAPGEISEIVLNFLNKA